MWMGVTWREVLVSLLHKHSFCNAPTPKLGAEDSRPMASISIIKAMSANIKFVDVTNSIKRYQSLKFHYKIESAHITAKTADEGIWSAIECLCKGRSELDASDMGIHNMKEYGKSCFLYAKIWGLKVQVLCRACQSHNFANPGLFTAQDGETVSVFAHATCLGISIEVGQMICVRQVQQVQLRAIEQLEKIYDKVVKSMVHSTLVKNIYKSICIYIMHCKYQAPMSCFPTPSLPPYPFSMFPHPLFAL